MFANLGFSEILTFILGGILIIKGLISLITGRVFEFNADSYTADSLRAYALPMGLCNVVLGVGLVLFQLLVNTVLPIGALNIPVGPVILAIMLAVSIVLLVKARKLLVKK